MEVKSNQKSYQKSQKQLFDGKERLEEVFAALGLTTLWKYVGVFFAQFGTGSPLFNCEKCSMFAIVDIKTFPEKMKAMEKEIAQSHENWEPSEHVEEFVEVAKQILFIAQGDPFAPVTGSGIIKKTNAHILRASTFQSIMHWTPQQLSVIQALSMAYVVFDGFYSTGKSEILRCYGKDKLKKGGIVHYFNHRPIQMKHSPNVLPFTLMLQKEFPNGVVKESAFRFGIDSVKSFLSQHAIESHHHVIFDELICNDFSKRFLDSILAIKTRVASLWIAMGCVPLLGEENKYITNILTFVCIRMGLSI